MEQGWRQFCHVEMTAESGESTSFYIANSINEKSELLCYSEAEAFMNSQPAGDEINVNVTAYGFGNGGDGGYADDKEIELIREHFDTMKHLDLLYNLSEDSSFKMSGQNQARVLILEPGKDARVQLISAEDEAMQAIIGGKCDTQHWNGNVEYLYSKNQHNTDSSIANRNIRAFIYSDTVVFRAYHSTPYNFSYISLTDKQSSDLMERFGKPERYADEQLTRNKYLRFPDSDAPENLDYIMYCMGRDMGGDEDDLEV